MTTTSSLLQGAHPVTVVVTTRLTGVNATGLGSLPGKMLLDTDNGAEYYNTGTALAPVWTLAGARRHHVERGWSQYPDRG